MYAFLYATRSKYYLQYVAIVCGNIFEILKNNSTIKTISIFRAK